MVEIDNSETAVIANLGESAIELDSSQQVAMTQINCVIKKGGANDGDACGAHPSQCAVGIDDDRCKIAARSVSHDVVVAQIPAVCTWFHDDRVLITTRVIESGCHNRDDSLL